MLGNGPGPNKAGLTIVMYLYNTGFVTGDLGYASTIGWTLTLGVLARIEAVHPRWLDAGKTSSWLRPEITTSKSSSRQQSPNRFIRSWLRLKSSPTGFRSQA